MIDSQIDSAVLRYSAENYGPATFAQYASDELNVDMDASDFRGCTPDEALRYAQDRAIQAAPTFVQETMDENLNPDEDPKDWKWLELTRAINTRFGLKLSDRDLKKVGREGLSEFLLSEAEKSILARDLSGGKRFLDPNYSAESLADWARQKFNLKLAREEVAEKDVGELAKLLKAKARESYRLKDVEFPVQVGLAMYLPEKTRPDRRPDRDKLFHWCLTRLASGGPIPEEAIRTESRAKIKDTLLAASRGTFPVADLPEIEARIEDIFSGANAAEADDAQELVEWCKTELKLELASEKLVGMTAAEALSTVLNAYDLKYRPEMHQTERSLLIEQIDSAWKSHLLTMDHLRSTVGLAGYAQEDPKIVFKREGMKVFDIMWQGINDRVSESVFRMEDVGDEQVEMAMWAGARAQHQQAESAVQARAAAAAREQASQQSTNTGEAKKPETIRNLGAKVGRNDPCPCGSGKKYKNCHMKIESGK
jgi:preprotein translocase subunit SecA